MAGRVVVVGSVNVDLVVVASRLPGPGETVTGGDVARHHGGKGGNQAVAAARLGADVAFVGAVGDDDFGAAARAALVAEGIDVTHLLVAPRPTGVALIVVDERAENLIAVAPGANASPTPASVTAALGALAIGPGDVVLVSCEIPPEAIRAALAAARAAGATSVLNPAPADGLDPATIALADVLTPNEAELALLAGAATGGPEAGADAGAATAGEQPAAPAGAADVEVLARRLLAHDAGRAVVVTLGAAGALAVPADGPALAIPATPRRPGGHDRRRRRVQRGPRGRARGGTAARRCRPAGRCRSRALDDARRRTGRHADGRRAGGGFGKVTARRPAARDRYPGRTDDPARRRMGMQTVDSQPVRGPDLRLLRDAHRLGGGDRRRPPRGAGAAGHRRRRRGPARAVRAPRGRRRGRAVRALPRGPGPFAARRLRRAGRRADRRRRRRPSADRSATGRRSRTRRAPWPASRPATAWPSSPTATTTCSRRRTVGWE